jgi:hypothetical protein
MLLALVVPSVATAEPFFNDEGGTKPWMSADAWGKEDYNGGTINEIGDQLQVTSNGNDDTGGVYYSKWAFNMDSDFSFSVNYYYDHVNAGNLAEVGALMIGVGPTDSDDRDDGIKMMAGNANGGKAYAWDWRMPPMPGQPAEGPEFSTVPRISDSGTFTVSYDAALQKATFASTGGASKIFDLSFIEPDSFVGVAIGGGGEWATFNGSNAYFTNFSVTSGTPVAPPVAPEPISSALFLLGGGVLAARRLKKNTKS